jgi:integrase
MAALRKRNDIPALALQFLILTTARRNEALHAKWPDVNLEERLWLCPIEDMKGKRVHIVPLSDSAIEILEYIRKSGLNEDGNPFIFVGMKKGKSISEKTMARVLATFGYEATPHGFRSTMRDWAGDETEHSREVAELSLAHKIGDATEQAYRRGTAIKKRSALMQDWADYLAGKHETDEEHGNLVPFRARKAK